ncbi:MULTISPECIES: autotransporter domain-containing protein [Polaromonas]|uniref:Autotransporter domain-containing protein n=1 Tax=Polaromonas aquatica TaxID=332657 RepID=A0ABW1TU98_9BURK
MNTSRRHRHTPPRFTAQATACALACAAIASFAPLPAFACQGLGGDVPGTGGVSLANGNGGNGGTGQYGTVAGGAGAAALHNAATSASLAGAFIADAGGNGLGAAASGAGAGNGGGAGGFGVVASNMGTFSVSATTQVAGGAGGTGGAGLNSSLGCGDAGGGGGQGGGGILLTDAVTLTNRGSISGAAGGDGGVGNAAGSGNPAGVGGTGGAGGAGVVARTGATVTNASGGTVTGGHGGAQGVGSPVGSIAIGGVGVSFSGDGNKLVNAGTITGGFSGDNNTRANAVSITGTNNTVELQSGYVFNGNVVAAGSGNTFTLGGNTDASFDVSTFGPGNTYQGFDGFTKTGSSVWTLTGNGDAGASLQLTAGGLTLGTGLAAASLSRSTGTGATVSGSAGTVLTVSALSSINGINGGTGSNGADSAPGAGGQGSNHGLADGSANDGGNGGQDAPGAPGQPGNASSGVGAGGKGGYAGGGTIYDAGGGGGGGGGVAIDTTGNLVNNGTITGGAGGKGGSTSSIKGYGGGGGSGGAAVHAGSGATITNASGATLMGGRGGDTGNHILATDAGGAGGAGIVASGNATVINAGTIAGGAGGSAPGGIAGATGNAVSFFGGGNVLDVRAGGSFTGNIVSSSGTTNGGDTLRLGGDADAVGGNIFAINNVSGFNVYEKTGASTWTLTGTGTASQNWNVAGGTLAGDSTSLQGNITNNAAVNFDQAFNGVYAGTISGSGSFTKSGTGVLTLSGANVYSGGTTVLAGTLQGDTASLQGNITNNATLTFNQAANGSYNGIISGTGTLNKTGAGVLNLTGANLYTGGTTVSAGTLQGDSTSLQGNITNNAAVTFAQTTTGTYAGVVSGTGAFNKLGAGNLILTGTNTYNGATTVNAGTLSVNGSIANSAVTVNNGGTLGGNGTLGSTSILSGGVLAPGNSIGTLNVAGNLSFAAGSIYRVEVNAAGANDRINATGTATLTGGTVDVQAGAGTYAANTQYTILNAAGGRTGNFAGVTSNLAFLTPTLTYDSNNVFLMLARNDISFRAVAVTPNQIATSIALQNANAGATGDMSTVQTALTGLSAAQARAAYDSASGAGIVALRQAGAGFATSFGSQLQARLGAQAVNSSSFTTTFSSQPMLLAANSHLPELMAPGSDSGPQKFSRAGGSSLSASPRTANQGLWVRGYGGYGNTDSDGNAAASQLRSSGLSVGFDQEVKDGLRLGAAATAGTSRLSTDNNETGKSRNSAVALYGSYAKGPWNFSGSASVSWGKNHMDRNVVVGEINRVASSDFDGNTLAAYGEATYSLPMNGWTLHPLAGLSLSRNKTDGFTETGAGALNLQVAGQTINSAKSMLGVKASVDAGSIRFEPRMIWAHEFGDLNTPMTAQFQGAATASPFTVSGAALKRDTWILGLGAAGSISKGMDLFADMQAEHNEQQRNLVVLVGLRSRW